MPRRDDDTLLARALGETPPEGLACLPPEHAEMLAALIEDARIRQQRQLQTALGDALGDLRRVLRGPVRRVLFPEGRP